MKFNPFFEKTVLIKEEHDYSFNELENKFECGEEKIKRILKDFSSSNIVKKNRDDSFKFTYVGVIIIKNIIIYCIPKYMYNFDLNKDFDKFKTVMSVIRKYDYNKSDTLENDLIPNDSSNILPLLLYFIFDYYEYGLYENTQDIVEVNGNGEILWDKTINNNFPIINNNRPYYFELFTKKRVNDYNNYFRRLHEIILNECFEILDRAKLSELFDILTIPNLTNDNIADFDDVNHILRMIDQEIDVQFNTRKQKLLKAMKKYINKDISFGGLQELNLYGTSSFYVIWEDVCKTVFNDMLNNSLNNLQISLNEKFIEQEVDSLKSLIEKPKWVIDNVEVDGDTYIPDLITIYNNNFLIFDAKYYDVKISDNKITDQPGIESITKQYMYELAFRDFIDSHELKVHNSFLFPIDGRTSINGYVELNLLHDLKLKNINTIFISANEIYDCYLKNSVNYNESFKENLFKKLIEID